MVMKVNSYAKGFFGILLATVFPTLIMFAIFASTYEFSITGIWTTVILAGIAILVYGILVGMIGVKKYMRK
jgi:hypothetical protein